MALLLSLAVVLLCRRWTVVLFVWMPLGMFTDIFLMLPFGTTWILTAALGLVFNLAF